MPTQRRPAAAGSDDAVPKRHSALIRPRAIFKRVDPRYRDAMSYLLVMAGGAIGAALRHLVGRFTLGWFGPGLPYGTLAVNLIGGLAMGVLVGMFARHGASEQARLFLGVGVLGGFTTFSAFSLDAMLMIERGALVTALGYVAVSVAGSIAALAAGLAITRGVA